MPRLATHLPAEQIVELAAGDRDGALRALAEVVVALEPGLDLDELVAALREREALVSTGFGGGLAMPHVRLAGVTQLRAALGRSRSGLDYQALDEAPVHLLLLIVGPARDKERYQKLMARGARFLKDHGHALIHADDLVQAAASLLADS